MKDTEKNIFITWKKRESHIETYKLSVQFDQFIKRQMKDYCIRMHLYLNWGKQKLTKNEVI